MDLNNLKSKFEGLNLYVQRSVSEDYWEIVIYNKDITEWENCFFEILGVAVKPKGQKPTPEHQNLAKDYGGIFPNQILYAKEFDTVTVISMFWPWGNDTHTTIKTILLMK